MTDDQLRALVRDAVARHLGVRPSGPLPVLREASLASPVGPHTSPWSAHPSHYQYVTLVSSSDACVIEPTVGCDHCGYCKSHGH